MFGMTVNLGWRGLHGRDRGSRPFLAIRNLRIHRFPATVYYKKFSLGTVASAV
jgi:hypothetical protein